MHRMIKLLGRFLLPLIVVACASSPPPPPPPPHWINNPGDGAVGSSLTHVRGRHFQEEMAISRARERLAARYGVEISSIQTINEKVANDNFFVTSEKQITQRVDRKTVKAQVRATWHDRQKDELWVWMYPIND